MAIKKKRQGGAQYTDPTPKPVKPTRKERKRAKKAPLPLHRQPIVCPPDGAGRSTKLRLIGYAARIFVLFFAVFGFSFFIADAFRFHYSDLLINFRGEKEYVDTAVTGTIFLSSLLSTLALSAFGLFRKARPYLAAAAGVTMLTLIVLALAIPAFGQQCVSVLVSFVNSFLERLHRANYFTLIPQLPLPETGLSEEFRIRCAGAILSVIVALMFVPFLLRKARILPPVIFSAGILSFIFVCNLSRSNWAFVLMLSSFAALIVMSVFDKLYQNGDRTETRDGTLFPNTDRPTLSEEAWEAVSAHRSRKERSAAAREARKVERAAKRAQRRAAGGVTVDEELSDYFGDGGKKKQPRRPQREASPRLTPAEKKAKKAQARADAIAEKQKKARIRGSIAAVRRYDRVTEDARAAMGGLAAVSVFLVLMLILVIPAATVDGRFQTIPAIDERLEYVREYLTAVLVGDEDVLDKLEYEKDPANFAPHSAELLNRYYNGTSILYVRSHDPQNLYMKKWIGTDYDDGAWLAASEEQREAYGALF
ncbi:MAG: hypothetical protein J6B77_06460, partial [Clostridia bacterium]|nr:hypothetical protein [Clostridia bacterium]